MCLQSVREVKLATEKDFVDSNDIIHLLEKQYETTGLKILRIAASELRRLYKLLDQEVLRIENGEPENLTIRMGVVLKMSHRYFGMPVDDITSHKRSLKYMAPRQVTIYVARKLTDLSTPQVGKWFGGRDHTTVIHACKKVQQEIEKGNKQWIKYVDELSALCKKEAAIEHARIEEAKRCQQITNLSLRRPVLMP